jgi:hypothetical protein
VSFQLPTFISQVGQQISIVHIYHSLLAGKEQLKKLSPEIFDSNFAMKEGEARYLFHRRTANRTEGIKENDDQSKSSNTGIVSKIKRSANRSFFLFFFFQHAIRRSGHTRACARRTRSDSFWQKLSLTAYPPVRLREKSER